MNVVISQSMYFPWVGLLEQIRLADVFIHYDDVQFTRGFYNRVQVKSEKGMQWMTVPLRDWHRGQRIDEVRIDNRQSWRDEHRALLARSYRSAPFAAEMLALVDRAFSETTDTLAQISRVSVVALSEYFGLNTQVKFLDSRSMHIDGSSSQRLHDLVQAVDGSTYITGHGARNYLDHELFERSDIAVEYMNYEMQPYTQQFGAFTPFVSGLDLVANCGREGANVIVSESTHWRGFVNQPA